MVKHKYIEPPKKTDYINNLKKLLNYHNIEYSMSELKSYSKKELKYLNYKYKIRLKKVDLKNNYWYRTSIFN